MRRFSLLVLGMALVAPSCTSESGPSGAEALRGDFPGHAAAILEDGHAITDRGTFFELDQPVSGWHNAGLRVQLPVDANQPVELHSGNFSIKLHEEGLTGEAALEEDAVVYSNLKGNSFWMMNDKAAEEWLLLPAGVQSQRDAVTSWRVEGGVLSEHNGSVVVRDSESGSIRFMATAPAAYGPKGQPIDVELKVKGDRIFLHVAVSPGPVLVDPSWIDYATMASARGDHASTLLANGNVLTSGGNDFGFPFNTVESYNEATATWSALPNMNTSRAWHTATTLSNGQVFGGRWLGRLPALLQHRTSRCDANNMGGRPVDGRPTRDAHRDRATRQHRVVVWWLLWRRC